MEKKVYEYTQVQMAYHSEKMEGCALSFDECKKRFRNPGDCEVSRHFKLFDYMLETQGEPVTEKLILAYHSLMADGDYRTSDSTMDKVSCVICYEEIPKAMKNLIRQYAPEQYQDIVEFLAKYERIKPFKKQSGAVGRMIVFKECLRMGIEPVIVYTGQKTSPYFTALAEYETNPEHFRVVMRKMRNRYAHEIAKLSET